MHNARFTGYIATTQAPTKLVIRPRNQFAKIKILHIQFASYHNMCLRCINMFTTNKMKQRELAEALALGWTLPGKPWRLGRSWIAARPSGGWWQLGRCGLVPLRASAGAAKSWLITGMDKGNYTVVYSVTQTHKCKRPLHGHWLHKLPNKLLIV